MIELIFFIIGIGIFLAIVIFGSVIFVTGMAYGYWGLSIVMAPILWLLMIIGALIGLFYAIKNAIKALGDL